MREIVIKSGTYFDVARDYAISTLNSLLPEKSWVVSIKERQKRRTDAQNRALWGVAYATIREATGNDTEDLHEYFLGEYFGWEEYDLLGMKRLRPIRRSRKLSTKEFMDFYMFVQARAAQIGIDVPNPGEF